MSSHNSFRSNKRHLLTAAIASLAINGAHAGNIEWSLEEPAAGGNYSGISNVRGWAVSSVGIDRAELYIDGVYKGTIPTGGLRGDIANAYADYPDADKAGFSAIRNYSLLDPAQSHSVTVKVIDNDGDSKEETRTITTSRFGDSTYIDNSGKVSLDDATINGSGNTISIMGMRVDGVDYDADLGWDSGAQGMGFGSIAASSSTGGNGGGGSCVNIPFPSNGTQVTWEMSTTNDGVSVVSEVATTYTSISSTSTTSATTTTSSSQGATITSQSTTEQQYSIADGYLYVSRIETDATSTTSVQGYNVDVDTNSLITFSPDWLSGPVGEYCVGQTWTSQPVTQTITVNGVTNTTQTEQVSGVVDAISETVTVAGGTFSTVRITTQNDDGSISEWTDVNTGVLVKSTGTTDEGQVTWELTALN